MGCAGILRQRLLPRPLGQSQGDDRDIAMSRWAQGDTVLPRLGVIATHVLMPAAMFWLASTVVFDATPVIRWLAAYRPRTAQSTLELNVSRQVLAPDARLRESSGPPIVAI